MRIRIGYRNYELRDWDNLEGQAHQKFGMCDTNNAKIYVDRNLSIEKRVNTTIHEMLHAVWKEMCLPDDDSEERIVESLANGITQIFKDNPDFVSDLITDLK